MYGYIRLYIISRKYMIIFSTQVSADILLDVRIIVKQLSVKRIK